MNMVDLDRMDSEIWGGQGRDVQDVGAAADGAWTTVLMVVVAAGFCALLDAVGVIA